MDATFSEDVKFVRISVDYENNAVRWWDAGGRELWEKWAGEDDSDSDSDALILEEHMLQYFLEDAERIEGWSDGPNHARTPVVINDLDW